MTAPGPAGPPTPYPVLPGHGVPASPGPPGVPAPPPGPGVTPPFAAPPTEGRTLRVWLGLGVGALALVLCCGGGGAALVGLALAGSQAMNEQARAVVGDYMGAVQHKDFGRAYNLLCDDDQRRESPADFERRVAAEPEIAAYHVGQAAFEGGIVVPVDVVYSGGGQDVQRVVLAQDTGTGQFEVCGVS